MLEIKDMIGAILTELRGGADKLGATTCKMEEEEYIVRKLYYIFLK